MKKIIAIASIILLVACDPPTADQAQSMKQAQSLQEAVAQVGMPEIVNFQEKRMMKNIYEMRDQTIATHSYIVNQMSGCLVYLGASVGYGIPYATQYTAAHKPYTVKSSYTRGDDQAEPNGLYMPNDAHGTWVMLKDPASTEVKPVYIEPDVIVSPFRLTARECK